MDMSTTTSSAADTSVTAEKLMKILSVVEDICQGNFESRVKSIPIESGLERQLSIKINEMIDRADAYVRESSACLSYIANNQYFRRISPEGLLGAYGNAAREINSAADGIEQKTEKFSQAVESISSAAVQLSSSAQQMGDSIKTTSERTATVSSAAEEAGTNTQTVASAAEELNASIQEINRQVTTSATMSADAVIQSQEVNKMVSGLSEASDKIGHVVNLIRDIAGQTKLLALNATIEAARAGDAGKGFAVVASEVKNLSAQTEQATKDIKTQVEGIQTAAGSAVTSIADIGKTIEKINEVSSAIASAVEEQGAATQEISRNVQETAVGVQDVTTNVGIVNENVLQISEGSEQVLKVAQELKNQAEMLTVTLNS